MSDAIHFGLNQDKTIDSVKVVWNDNTRHIIKNIKPNQTITISQQDGNASPNTTMESHETLFTDITNPSGINFTHKENNFNDFKKETLLPHRMSQLGPALAVADVNGDGLEDFFIGGAKGYPSALYLQNTSGKFSKSSKMFASDKNYEDVGAVFFDADNDGDQDLYVISGGIENEPNNSFYLDRLYENTGEGNFNKNVTALPKILSSGLRVSATDFDKDGDIDLFVGGRVKPGFYGRTVRSYLLRNDSNDRNISFTDVTEELIPELLNHTMITASTWADIDEDGDNDLLIASEWGSLELFTNNTSSFKNNSKEYGLSKHVGWWSSIEVNDIDNDGDLDIIAGNLGLNYKYKASFEKPFYMYINDFDENGTDDIVLGYSQGNKVFPVRGRQCTSDQMPFIKEKFKNYNDFGSSNINDIYGEKLMESISYEATCFASAIFKNVDDTFEFHPFENRAQLSSVNKILVDDFNNDQKKDILLLGNLYGSEVETPRNDASYGSLLTGKQNNQFEFVSNDTSGLWAGGDVKDAAFIKVGTSKAILIARNNGKLSLMKINKTE